MCSAPLGTPAYLVDGSVRHGRRWSGAQLLICGDCYTRGGPDPKTGLSRPDVLRENARHRWLDLVGRGDRMPGAPCVACGLLVVRRGDPLLKRVTCSRACSTSLTRTRTGGQGSGMPCETCGTVITTGRADARYCGSACRQKAYRQRQGADAAPVVDRRPAVRRARGRTVRKSLTAGISGAEGLAEGMSKVVLDETVSPEQAEEWSKVLTGEILPRLGELAAKLDVHQKNGRHVQP